MVFVSGELPLPKFQILQIDSCDKVVVLVFWRVVLYYPELKFQILQIDRCDKVVGFCFQRVAITQISNFRNR